jgi:phenylacetate-CoA ligase
MWKSILTSVLQTKTEWANYYRAQDIDISKVESLAQFNQLPVLKKNELPMRQREKFPFAGFVQEDEVARIFVSPGPIYDPQGVEEDYWRFSSLLKLMGVNQNDIVQNTFSYHFSPAAFMFDSAARALRAKVIPAGTGNSDIQVQVMKDLQSTVYAGTPSFLVHLLRLAEEKGFHVGEHLSLRKAIFTAEKLTKEMDQFLKERDIRYVDSYGTADVGCIAYRLYGESSYTIVEGVFVQICDPVTGEEVAEGEIGEVVISMASQVYPLLRFGTGDLSKWTEYGTKIAGMLGRAGDSYKVKGMFVHAHQLGQVIDEIPSITYYQASIDHHEGLDQFTIKVEVNLEQIGQLEQGEQGINKVNRDDLQQKWALQIQNLIRVRPQVEVVETNSIPRDEKKFVDARGVRG